MDVHEVATIMRQGSHLEKISLLCHLRDTFESYNQDIENFDPVVQLLVHLAVASEDEEMTDNILGALCSAAFKEISRINFDPIEENLKTFSVKCLARGIDVLSYTHDKKYLPTLLEYQNHNDAVVRESVRDALIEMGETTIE